jgi:hypothetical protein
MRARLAEIFAQDLPRNLPPAITEVHYSAVSARRHA